MPRCSRCQGENPPAQKFCGQCGAPLGTSPQALQGERKQVSVLFADIQGSLEMFADKDPEEARRVLDPVLKAMIDAVQSYEGTVNRVMGDGVMGTFGAPIAHEEHALLACYAGLKMQRQIAALSSQLFAEEDPGIRVRVGINSGEVVVRTLGSDLHMDYTAVGLAARVEQLAAPGSVVVTADTLRLAEGYVEARSFGKVPIKGLPAPIEVFELTGASSIRSRLKLSSARGLTPFVGRRAESAVLAKALARAAAVTLSCPRMPCSGTQRSPTEPPPGKGRSWRWWASRGSASPAWRTSSCTRSRPGARCSSSRAPSPTAMAFLTCRWWSS